MDKVVIVANGTFPQAPHLLEIIDNAPFILSCDGATDKLLAYGKEPNMIIGDLDSISPELKKRYKAIVQKIDRQDNTDLMKALDWCVEQGVREVLILGASGEREDHTIGNVFTITRYAFELNIILHTDTGNFVPLAKSQTLSTRKGQQVSLFPQPVSMRITTEGLKYALNNKALGCIQGGTLNEAEGESISLRFDEGVLLVFRTNS